MQKSPLLFVGAFIVLALVILTGFVLWQKREPVSLVQSPLSSPSETIPPSISVPNPAQTVKPISASTTSNELPSDDTMGWKTYRNKKYGFEVKYDPRLFYDIYDSPYASNYANLNEIRDPRLDPKVEFSLREFWDASVGNNTGGLSGDPQFSIAFYDIKETIGGGINYSFFEIILKDRVQAGSRNPTQFDPQTLHCVLLGKPLDLVDAETIAGPIGITDICNHPPYIYHFINYHLPKALVDEIFSTFRFIGP